MTIKNQKKCVNISVFFYPPFILLHSLLRFNSTFLHDVLQHVHFFAGGKDGLGATKSTELSLGLSLSAFGIFLIIGPSTHITRYYSPCSPNRANTALPHRSNAMLTA